MAGIIGALQARQPDPDGGRLMRRLLCPVADVPAALGWGSVIGPQVAMAGRMAAVLWDVPARAACPAAYAD